MSSTDTILLVDDSDNVRRLTKMVLEMGGYKVLEASDPNRGLELAAEHDEIKLALSDVLMPQMNGRAFADALLLKRPNVKVLFMSGFSDAETLRNLRLPNASSILQKPFDPDTLLAKVQEALQS